MDYATLKVGQEVAVARNGSWNVHSEGVYTVVKVDKVKIVLRRADGYERTFSVKRRCELGRDTSFRAAYLESVEDMNKRTAQQLAQRVLRDTWAAAEQAAHDKDLLTLKQLVAKLEQLAV